MHHAFLLPALPFYLLNRYKNLPVILLILCISISPRINVGALAYGRALQFRYEDFLLILILISWFSYLCISNKKIYGSTLLKPISLYLLLASFSTSLGILAGWIEPVRASFFLLKEIEYFLIFFVVINYIKDHNGLRTAIYAILTLGFANGLYALFQIFSGGFKGYYLVGLIGESGSFPTGGYFSAMLLLASSTFYLVKRKNVKVVSGICILTSLVGLLASLSRTNILATLSIMLLFIIFLSFSKKSIRPLFLPLFGVAAVVILNLCLAEGKFSFLRQRLTCMKAISYSSFQIRGQENFKVLIDVIAENPVAIVFGFGKSIVGTKLPVEAHNHYIRILSEMGISGLIVFLYLLFSIIKMAYIGYRNNLAPYGKAVCLACLMFMASRMIAAIGQDAFTPVRPNEMLWAIVGLMVVALRIDEKPIRQ